MSSRNYALKGETRDRAGKGVARALRRENQVPAVVYGDGKPAASITLADKEINLEYLKGHMYTSLCTLNVGGTDNLVLARDVQLHPVTDRVIHVDFLRVTPKTKLHVKVPLEIINQDKCPGITQEKGILNIAKHELDIVCLATDIPDHIDVDVSGLSIGDALRLDKLKLPEGAKADPRELKKNITILTVIEPRRIIEVAPVVAPVEGAEGAAPAEGAEGAAAAAPGAAPAAGAAAGAKAPAAGGDKGAAKPAGDKGGKK
ncbi:MAG TPA: 50S ribosomal protein L25/general stress protein Ctc [Patescibacteria group bacterium]|nr:50S ribosomal protein L25/general stress protein Ctc [Patescibacteria group bacterium]